MENIDTQDIIECPYEKHHQILRSRMQVHLTRCRRNHKNVKKVTCPFNVTHVLNEPELQVITQMHISRHNIMQKVRDRVSKTML